jgi:3-isopropylmalate dehydrogenase
MKKFNVAVLPGDGIGQEVMPHCCALLEQLATHFGSFSFDNIWMEAGAACYQKTGEALPQQVIEGCRDADAILLGAMGLPSVRYPDGTEIAPQLDLRFDMNLYAGVRPVKPMKHLPLPLRNADQMPIDFVLIRESTEGLFASHGKGVVHEDQYATDTMKITRAVSERLFEFSFKLARRRKEKGFRGCLTCVDKANVFSSMAFFRKIYDEIGSSYNDIEKQYMYVDAAALNMVKQPWNMDVLVTENMFGDILSDLGAGLMGGMGMAPSADIGDSNAVFQPCHGSAPDIAGQGKANPTAMLLSGAMMLDWLGEQHGVPDMIAAAEMIDCAVENAFASAQLMPYELGGDAGTQTVYGAVVAELEQLLK